MASTSLASLQAEISKAEERLAILEEHEDVNDSFPQVDVNPVDQLERLNEKVTHLELTERLVDWAKTYAPKGDVPSIDALEGLEQILGHHQNVSVARALLEQEYQPLYRYLQSHHVLKLRRLLIQSDYPTKCENLLEEWDQRVEDNRLDQVKECCQALERIQMTCRRLSSHFRWVPSMNGSSLEDDLAILELCRPFVDRIAFHFVEEDPDRLTSSRIDRLPEWLFNYVKENVFADAVWEFIQEVVPADAFLHEIIRLLQWVLTERNFFRHELIVGDISKPVFLTNAIEEVLRMDQFLGDLAPQYKLVRLMDACVAGDEELFDWWMENEKAAAFHTLFSEDIKVSPDFVSPRAELFCACIRSIRTKASVFSFRGPYLSSVAAPLCMQFLDAIRDSANDLSPTDYLRWIRIINGTDMAAELLTASEAAVSEDANGTPDAGERDLARFGTSLKALRDALVDEFAHMFVERILMEKAKLVSFLMRCSYLVSTQHDGEEDDLSSELVEAQHILQEFHQMTLVKSEQFQLAPRQMRDRVLARLSEKLLVVALDSDGMTPELVQEGCSVFARNVQATLDIFTLLPPVALRLMDVTRLMSLDRAEMSGIGNALCGLADLPAPLTLEPFEMDDTLASEAVAMIQAKGFLWITMEDVLAVLNRRIDL